MQLSCSPGKQGELSEKFLQNLFSKKQPFRVNYLNIVEQSADKVVEHLDGHPSQPLSDRPLAADAAARGVAAVARVAGARRPEDEAVGLHRGDGRRGPGRGHCGDKDIT